MTCMQATWELTNGNIYGLRTDYIFFHCYKLHTFTANLQRYYYLEWYKYRFKEKLHAGTIFSCWTTTWKYRYFVSFRFNSPEALLPSPFSVICKLAFNDIGRFPFLCYFACSTLHKNETHMSSLLLWKTKNTLLRVREVVEKRREHVYLL